MNERFVDSETECKLLRQLGDETRRLLIDALIQAASFGPGCAGGSPGKLVRLAAQIGEPDA